jgi:hypothetical protein
MAKSGESQFRGVRWGVWLGLGAIAGVGIGFSYGLVKPRARA